MAETVDFLGFVGCIVGCHDCLGGTGGGLGVW